MRKVRLLRPRIRCHLGGKYSRLQPPCLPTSSGSTRQTGSLSAWVMHRTTLATLATVTPNVVSDLNWKIVGVADFYRDGHHDILWQHQATGGLSAWLMNETTLAELATVTPNVVSDTNWKIVGVADFNRDGHPDILWQHQATGGLSAWLMNGTSLAHTLAVVTPNVVSDTNWKIVGVADFNNDGHPDILWQHQATGGLSVWLMDGGKPGQPRHGHAGRRE